MKLRFFQNEIISRASKRGKLFDFGQNAREIYYSLILIAKI